MVYLREKISPSTPAERDPTIPPTWRIEVSQPVAVEDATTVGKFCVKRVMTKDWPSTPC